MYSEGIDKLDMIQETPQAIRGKKKKEKNIHLCTYICINIFIYLYNIETLVKTSSKMPKGTFKDNQKKKTKTVSL